MKRLKRAFAACVLLSAAAIATADAAEPSATLLGKAPKAASLIAKAGPKGKVRVIITLNRPIGAAAVGAATDAQLKASTRQVVDPFLSEVLGVDRSTVLSTGVARNASVKAASTSGALPGSNVKVMPFLPIVAADVSAADLERIAADPRVRSISLDALNKATLAESVPLIGGVQAAAAGATGNGYQVAILDTGVQYAHPFFSGRVTHATCHSSNSSGFTSLCPNGQTEQYGGNAGINCASGCEHGSHVAGIAAGGRTSGTPSRGVAPQASIFAIQVFSRSPDGRVLSFTSDMIAGLQDVYENRTANKIAAANMSIGGGSFTANCDGEAIKSTIDLLRTGGVATVISSGNDGTVNAVSFPSCVSTAVTVGSSTKYDTISSFSNMSALVDVMAPGSSIYSSVPTNSFMYMDGTSMAAPHVAGAFTALKSAVPTATVADIEAALKATGVTIVDNRFGGTHSKPRINVNSALTRLKGGSAGPRNDRFASAIAVALSTTAATSVTGSNVDATMETGEPKGNTGVSATVWWKFTASRSGAVRINTLGSAFDTTLGIYRGSSVSALTQVAFNDDSTDRTSALTFNMVSGTTYYVQVGGYQGATGAVKLTFEAPPPANDRFAGAQVLTVSASSVSVTGNNSLASLETGEPKFVSTLDRTLWYKYTPTSTRVVAFNTSGSSFDTTLAVYRGSALNALTLVASNDNNGTATTSRVAPSLTAGTAYYIQLGGKGTASGSVKLTYAPQGPANDMLAGAILLSGTAGTVTGTNVGASTEAGEVLPISQVQGTVWWKFKATATKVIDVSTNGSAFDTTLGVFTQGGSKGMALVAFNDDQGAATTSHLRFYAVSGRSYFIQVGGYGAARGAIKLSFPTGGAPLVVKSSEAAAAKAKLAAR